jgi:hypothetical protein
MMTTGLRYLLRNALATGFVLVAVSLPAQAKVFRNAYVSFELPDRWDCALEQTEFVCKTSNPGLDSREAIIVLTAKEVGPMDNLTAYEQHLKTPRTIASRLGQPLQSQVLKVEQRKIAQQPWVDGFHLASEIPSYYTRYLATTKDKIGILVTFSAHKLHYTKYSSDFFRAIESLRVTVSKSLLTGQGGGSAIPGSEIMGSGMQGGFAEGDGLPEEGSGSGTGSSTSMILGFAVVIGAVGAFLMLKRRKRK